MSTNKDINTLLQWLRIREEHGTKFPSCLSTLSVDIDHSSLLQRLLEGKQPLTIPPPLSHSYPWYSLIEEGYGHPMEVWEAPEYLAPDYPKLIIDQSANWRVLQKVSDNEWIATYQYHHKGEDKFHPDTWRVYQIGSRVPQLKHECSFNKLWKIEKIIT